MPPPHAPFTRADARDLFVGAMLARPEQQLPVLAQRLCTRTGARGVALLERRCGRIQSRDLLMRSPARDAAPGDLRLYGLAGPTPRLIDKRTLVISVPTTPPRDQLQPAPAHAVLALRFARNARFLSGRARSWPGLRVLANLTHTLLEAEYEHRLNSRLRRLQRRSVRPRRPGDLAYLALHATREVLGFDGHCALLLWEPADATLEVIAHVAGEGAVREDPSFAVHWNAPHADAVLGTSPLDRCFVASRDRADRGAAVWEMIDITPGSALDYAPASQDTQNAISRLTRRLMRANLMRGRSALVFPIRQGGTPLGMLVISAQARNAFATREVAAAWELALACIQPLGRASRLLGDLALSESILERTAAMEPDVPLEQNGPLTAILSLLCDRLAREVSADAVTLLPYAYKRGDLVPQGKASAGLDLGLDDHRLRPGGLVDQILRSDGPIEWYRSEGADPFELGSFVTACDVERLYGVGLAAPDGNPLGVVFIAWCGDTAGPDGNGKMDISRLDRQRTADFQRVAEAYLARHTAWFVELEGKRRLSDIYTDLLRSIGTGTENPVATDLGRVRHDILVGLLSTAQDLVGGTTALFAAPSGAHAGLDVLASVGHEPDLTGEEVPYGHGVTGRCADVKETRIIPNREDASTWPLDVEPRSTKAGARSEVAFPVTDGSVSDLLLGVFDLENQRATNAYGDSDGKMIREIAQAASIALGITRQLEQVQSIAALGRMIDDAIRDSEEDAFRVALEEAARVTGSFAASARVADRSGTLLLPVHHHGVPGRYADKPIAAGDGANGAAFRTERVVSIGDTLDPDTYPDIPRFNYLRARKETRSECAIPIHWHGHSIGACNFEHRQPHALVPFQLYLQTVGAYISHAVRQRRQRDRVRMTQEIELVEVLSSFYMTVVHTIARNFSEIRQQVSEVEAGLSGTPEAIRRRLRQVKSSAETGIQDAAALLAGAGGELEESVTVEIRALLDTVARRIAELHGAPERLIVDHGSPEASVTARQGMLGWIVQEVIQNSFAYAGDGARVWITVETLAVRSMVRIVLDDDGAGLEPERLERLYDPSAREKHDGHYGLGLIAASLYLRTMNGRMASVRSPRGGLRTSIELPWHRPTASKATRD